MDRLLKQGSGFTLIELVVTLVVVSLLALFVSTNTTLYQLQGINASAAAEQIANDIRYTQALAMTKGQRFYWTKISSTSYQINSAAGTAALLSGGTTTVTLTGGASLGTLSNLPNSLVAFDGTGTPYTTSSSPGTVLSAQASIPVTSAGETRTVVITPGTGMVTVQ
jgi:prepilin-type N-terminal cleavage/methylation domain-containing protein